MCKIEVLMSTYNGEKHIVEQIESIMNQKNVEVHLTIRDDASKDQTVLKIKKMIEKYPDSISLYVGENMGYKKSFLKLLSYAKESEYYAFSDQDDIWLDEKLCSAVLKLKKCDSLYGLYASNLTIVDENLKFIQNKDVSHRPLSLESYFVRGSCAGCTMVFSHGLKTIAQKFSNIDYMASQMPSHDALIACCALACGKMIIDDDSYIWHRRLKSSVTSGGNGLVKRIRTEYNIVFKDKNGAQVLARELLEKCESDLKDEAKKFLHIVMNYKKSIALRMKLLTESRMSCGIWICDLEYKLKVLIGRF